MDYLGFVSGYLYLQLSIVMHYVAMSQLSEDGTSRLQSHNVATLIHPQIGIVALKKKISSYNKVLHFLLTLQFPVSSFSSRGVSLGLDVSYISLFFLRGSFFGL